MLDSQVRVVKVLRYETTSHVQVIYAFDLSLMQLLA